MNERRRTSRVVSAHSLTQSVCQAVREAILAGEKRLHVTIDREDVRDDGTSGTEFLIVEGFACARESCPEPLHVYLHASDPWEARFKDDGEVESYTPRHYPAEPHADHGGTTA